MRAKFESIQYLRAFAALIVVFHHARNPTPWLYDPLSGFEAGQAGVDIFFVISGFIMFTAARDERACEFIRRRLVRIAPLYWLATAVTFVFVYYRDRRVLDTAFVEHIVKSILFVPHYSPDFPDRIWPYVVPGWTLNYEMFFYLVFACALLTRRLIPFVGTVLVGLVLAGNFIGSRSALWITYTDPLLLEFLGGIFLARYRPYLRHGWLVGLVPIGLLALALSGEFSAPRIVLWGVPAVAIVAGALACEDLGWLPRISWLRKLGDASYSIYLFQIVVVTLVSRMVVRFGLHGPVQLAAMIGGCLVGSALLGLVTYSLFERPINRYLARRRPAGLIEVQAAP